MKNDLDKLAKRIEAKHGFRIGKKIYQANYYRGKQPRNAIFLGSYRGKKAALKIYDDPRESDEPLALARFNKINKSKILAAPELYKYEVFSAKRGWLIMERLPAGARAFTSPLAEKARSEFIKVFLEYRKIFPSRPQRKLTLAERLPPEKFHLYRINRWLALAHSHEAESGQVILKANEFNDRFAKATAIIEKEFANRKMIWCHGHFKPPEIFKTTAGKYYLTDFAHSNLYPEGYEFAFIIWADYIMAADWRQNYGKWKKGINDLTKELRPVAGKLGIKKYDQLMKASLLERALGTILADICATDKPKKEKIMRTKLLYKLIDDLTK